ncbi:EAL domain-containing response regulator [Lysobacter enzymogenes]|uniref:EAL domain-containing response regulator n=1 Tax=Lysobacter enzymogenes TaxID=69 RepID=UPI00089BE29A|nr:EAL domain-containing response regulator [Lysobacter enzymogenes]SDX84700.1 EAL domain, c-di-GMP-specific phosphodiesterase class I (or its enzymatically inactive variant) [Lysobacter enzymogenes]
MSKSALSVLVVEDHGFQRRMALRLLAELGVASLHEAADGASALNLLNRLAQARATSRGDARGDDPADIDPAQVDLVLVDLDMPGMDGIEFIDRLAQQRLARAVLVVSALDPALLHTVQTMARACGLRVLEALAKPLTKAKLAEALMSLRQAKADEDPQAAPDITAEDARIALETGRIEPWFQLQVELSNGRAIGVEALARWRHDDGRVILPQHFVPLLEAQDLLDELTERMLAQACRYKRGWDREGLRLKLSVNVSASTLDDAGAADRYQKIVREAGVAASEVVLELTESSLMADAARGLAVLARLRLKGFGLSIDDFGTGWSSLSQLSQVPFTELKIDQEFVAGASHKPRKRAVVEASLDLARKLGLDAVAEGVETVEDWQMLAELGCAVAQGRLIGEAVPGAELRAALGRWRRPEH